MSKEASSLGEEQSREEETPNDSMSCARRRAWTRERVR